MGPERNLLDPQPESCRQIFLPRPVIDNDELAKLVNIHTYPDLDDFKTVVVPCLYRVEDGGAGLRAALDDVRRTVSDAIENGANIVVLSDRGSNAELAPIPALLFTSAVHHHLIREKTRTQVGLVVETGEAREVHHMCLLLGYGAAAVNPYLAFETIEDLIAEGDDRHPRRAEGDHELHQGVRQGRAQGDVEDGHQHGRFVHRRADLRSDRPVAGRSWTSSSRAR